GTRLIATDEADVNEWYLGRILDMSATDTVVSAALTGATVRCIATPEIIAFEEARLRGADAGELQALRQVARENYGHSDKIDRSKRRQGTAGQVAGMITDIQPAAKIVEDMINGAAALCGELHGIAGRGAMAAE
ncbi:MAG: nitronate monooxygenase, partial [Alphaproteobacteria bacterium]|nr:nitronate monooxygenase [Alphaproteobacteria bacterium]